MSLALLRRQIVCCLLAMSWLRASAPAGEWPQFRGPDGQGHSSEQGLPIEWSEQKNVAWKTAVPGRGWSSPVISGNRVWLTTATTVQKDTSLRLMAFDVETGKTALDVEVFKFRGTDLQN